MDVNYKENQDGSLSINLNFTKIEVFYLMHDLPGIEGIVNWYAKGPSAEKIYRCKERMQKECIPMLRSRGISIPSSDQELMDIILVQKEYKNRESRDQNNPSL